MLYLKTICLFQWLIFIACIFGSITFFLEIICFSLTLHYACKKRADSDKYTMFEEVVSMLTIYLEDLPMLTIFFSECLCMLL